MATVASRLTSTGTLFIAGEFDEVTTSSIRLTVNNQYAALLDEVTLQDNSVTFTPNPSYGEQAVFQDTADSNPNLRWRFGQGISYPRELNAYIYNGNVALGTEVYVKWQYQITLDGGSTWVDQEAYLGTVVGFDGMGSADTAYLYVTNPLGIAWRPSSNGTFIPGNIVAYQYTYVRFATPSVARRETSTGTLMVSGEFDEVNKPT